MPHAAASREIRLGKEKNQQQPDMKPSFGLRHPLVDPPAVVRDVRDRRSAREPAPNDSHRTTTAGSRRTPAGCEPLLGLYLPQAAHPDVKSKTGDCGPSSALHFHRPPQIGLCQMALHSEPPCLLHFGHVAARGRDEQPEEGPDGLFAGLGQMAEELDGF